MDWQPIDTAPKDCEILAWCPEWGGATFCVYSIRNDAWIDEWLEILRPTHWLKLEPPSDR